MVFFLGRWNGRWFLRRNHCSQWFSEGFLQFNHCCQLFCQIWTIGINGFSMVFDHRTIAIESMVLQSTIGDDGFSMVNEKKRQWFSKIAIYDKKLLLEFKLPTQIEIAQSYQEHHALLPHAMWTYICQNWDLNSSKWGPKFVKMGTHFEWNDDFFQQKWGPKKYIFQCSQWGFDKLFEISREACITHFEELYIIN